MLTKDERILLENVLDALDRVFDRESKVTDLYALLFATSRLFSESSVRSILESPIHELKRTVQSKASEEQQRDFALKVTDELRKFVVDELHRASTENPKQRHSP